MYYVAHVLPPQLNEWILPMKQDLYQRFGCAVGLKSPAHITLIPPFWLSPAEEPQLLTHLQLLARQCTGFVLTTRHFASFAKRTLFIAVGNSPLLHQLKQAADNLFAGNQGFGIQKEQRPFHPHITIATRDIKPHQFAAAWQLYGHQTFEHRWVADTISILRHNGSHWDVWATETLLPPGDLAGDTA